MDFPTQNLLAFQNLWKNQPHLFSEEARLSLSQIISELEEDLDKISQKIIAWCQSYSEIKKALAGERKKLGADIAERNIKGIPEVTDSPKQINPQEYIKWMQDNFASSSEVVNNKPSALPRYTDISCPRRVWKKTDRFSVVVRLTLQPYPYSDAPVEQLKIPSENLPVIVHLDAPAFECLNKPKPQQEIHLESNRDSIPAVFDLKPKDTTGFYSLNFNFFQSGHLLGATSTKIEITAYEVSLESISVAKTELATLVNSKASDLILYVKYDPLGNERSLRYTLFHDGLDFQDFAPVNLMGNLETYANTLYKKIANLFDRSARQLKLVEKSTNGNHAEIDRRIKQIGHNLWKYLVPDELKKDYLEHPEKWQGKTLLIVSDEPYIPWELVWPYSSNPEWEDEYPWCISMQLTRWLRHDLQENTHQLPPSELHVNKLACLAPAAAQLINAQKEKQFLETLICTNKLENVSPKDCYLSEIWKILETSQYNWFHIASHGNFKIATPDDASAILLENKEYLTLDDFLHTKIESHIQRTRPAFVFNSCHSGRQSWALRGLGGWPNHLIGMGAGLFLAPLWPVSDGCALQFAKQFYQELLKGKTVAEAMLSSRLAIKKDVCQGDSSWLAYSIYAHPNATVKAINDFDV